MSYRYLNIASCEPKSKGACPGHNILATHLDVLPPVSIFVFR